MSTIAEKAARLEKACQDYYGDLGFYLPEGMDIQTMFEPFDSMPAEGDFDTAREQVLAAMTKLSYGDSSTDPVTETPFQVNLTLLDIESVGGELDEWVGEAASSFRDHVRIPFPGVVENLFLAASVLHGALEAEAAMWKAVHEDIHDIADKAISAVEGMDDTDGSDGSFLITVIGSVVGVALAVPTGGASVAAVAGAFAIAGSAVTLDFSADEPMYLIPQVNDAIEKLKTDLTASEEKIQTALSGIAAAVEGGTGYRLSGAASLSDGPGGLTRLK